MDVCPSIDSFIPIFQLTVAAALEDGFARGFGRRADGALRPRALAPPRRRRRRRRGRVRRRREVRHVMVVEIGILVVPALLIVVAAAVVAVAVVEVRVVLVGVRLARAERPAQALRPGRAPLRPRETPPHRRVVLRLAFRRRLLREAVQLHRLGAAAAGRQLQHRRGLGLLGGLATRRQLQLGVALDGDPALPNRLPFHPGTLKLHHSRLGDLRTLTVLQVVLPVALCGNSK